MKTCRQILDSRFRVKINAVSPCDTAKRASPGKSASSEVHTHARKYTRTENCYPFVKYSNTLAYLRSFFSKLYVL